MREMNLFASLSCTCLLAAATQLTAGQTDGTYKVLRITSSFQQNGEPYKVPQKDLKESLFGSDGIVIRDNRLSLYQTDLFQNLKEPALLEIVDTVEITGQRKFLLKRSEDGQFRGRTDNPLVAKFSFDLFGPPLPVTMRVHSRARVDGNKLVVNMPIRAAIRYGDPSTEDILISGSIRIVAERL